MSDYNPELFNLAEKIYSAHGDEMEKLESRRKNHLLFLFAIIPVICGIIIFVANMVIDQVLPDAPYKVPIFIAFFCVVFTFSWQSLDRGYRHSAKNALLYIIANSVGLTYRRGGFITLGDLYDHQVLPPYAESRSEEGFSGQTKGIRFQFQDFTVAPVARVHWFDYRSYLWMARFYGIAIRIELGKKLAEHTVLMPSFLASGFLKIQLNEKFSYFENVNLVYNRFKKQYTVISRNQVEARYILDPAMIENVLAMGELLKARWLEMSVRKSEMIIIAAQTRNYFEISHLLRPVTVLTIEHFLLELDQIMSGIRALGMNSKSGLGATLPSGT